MLRHLRRLLLLAVCGVVSACGSSANPQPRDTPPLPSPAVPSARALSPELAESAAWAARRFDTPTSRALDLVTARRAAASGEAGAHAAAPAPLWIDARTREEFETSHLPGALWWDYRTAAPPLDAMRAAAAVGRPVVIYCSIGYRSGEAGDQVLAALPPGDPVRGRVANMEGGIFAWACLGGPLEGSAAEVGPTRQVHPFDATWGRLLPEALRAPLTPRGDGDGDGDSDATIR